MKILHRLRVPHDLFQLPPVTHTLTLCVFTHTHAHSVCWVGHGVSPLRYLTGDKPTAVLLFVQFRKKTRTTLQWHACCCCACESSPLFLLTRASVLFNARCLSKKAPLGTSAGFSTSRGGYVYVSIYLSRESGGMGTNLGLVLTLGS